MSIRTEARMVTPEWAKKVLEEQDKRIVEGKFTQRPLNQARIRRYTMDMKLGNWGENGESITFDEEGNLLNGQHRLHALARAGVTLRMVVVYDAPCKVNNRVNTIDTFDSGFSRNAAGQLRIEGYEYFVDYASCSRVLALMCFARGRSYKDCKPSTSQIVSICSIIRPTFDPLIHKMGKSPRKISKSSLTAPLTLLRAVDPDTADLFVTDYMEMVNLKKGSPIIALKRAFDRPTSSGGGTSEQVRGFMATASALWYYTKEKPIESIRGNEEHVNWLMDSSKNLVKKIREAIGADLTIEGLEGKS